MKKNWMYGSMVAALFAVLASSCGNSQQVLDFRGICVDDTHGENGIYNPGRGFRLETAVDVKEEKDSPTKELLELSAKYVADSVSLAQSYFYLTYLIRCRCILMNCRNKERRRYYVLPTSGILWGERRSGLPESRYWNIGTS